MTIPGTRTLTPNRQSEAPVNAHGYLVRIGTTQAFGRFRSDELGGVPRGLRVVCRSPRGLEFGQVLNPASIPVLEGRDLSDGWILRRMTAEDELLWEHLVRLSGLAREECSHWLVEHGIDATLIEVEPLLDGKTIYFHFLGEIDAIVQRRLHSLVKVYQRSVAQSRFARLLEHGCGPGCGTAEAKNGCGTGGGCAICQISGACTAKK